MKKILLGAALVAAGAAMAADSTQFGVLKVPSSAAETIVSVPWLESSTGTSAVTVSNLVLTSGLNDGDMLKWYNSSTGKYQCWTLNDGAWEAVNNVTSSGSDTSESASTTTIARGQAIILTRGEPIASCFYIMGKPATTTADDLALPAGTMAEPVWSLVAPPTVADVNVNTGLTWYNLDAWKDQLYIDRGGSLEVLTWTGTAWGGGGTPTYTIPAGKGAWFCGRGDGSNKSVKWTK